MLYHVGTQSEVFRLPRSIPETVTTEILQGVVALDAAYGEDRDYLSTGGYSVVLEYQDDLRELKAIVDYDTHQCEQAIRVRETGYISALYIMNDDFSMVVYLPIDIAPTAILNDLEDET